MPGSLLFRVNLTSLRKVLRTFFVLFLVGLLTFHRSLGKTIRVIGMISHALDIIVLLGSNTEKRFVII